jgi:hypothetical protein
VSPLEKAVPTIAARIFSSSTSSAQQRLFNMIVGQPSPSRELKLQALEADFCVVGGGLAGVCGAIAAARAGARTILLQDRPVLGGNASSEVRLWANGATAHMGLNNRFAREGGIIDEILVENLWRNPEGNPVIFDSILLEKTATESALTLLLNTAVFSCEKSRAHPDKIAAVRAFNAQNSTLYEVRAPLFLDASGDGILGFLAGAAFRMGAESQAEFDEAFAPSVDHFGQLLGHSIYFYTKNVGAPVEFVAPSFALRDVDRCIPRYKQFQAHEHGCNLWWIEWGGRLDTVHDSEKIKWELWRIIYGVWDYIKNSGKFPEAANLALEWVGHIPGKRESRRFEGPYMLSQKDIVQRRRHADAVAYGGWSIDLHPADGVFSQLEGSHHLYTKGCYQIPFRCYYSRNIHNLFLGGRVISATHVGFGSTRLMVTSALGGQAVGAAAALCREHDCLPADLSADPAKIRALRLALARAGHDQWGEPDDDPDDLARLADISASSQLRLQELPADGSPISLETAAHAQLFAAGPGLFPAVTLFLDVMASTEFCLQLLTTSRSDHHTPDILLGEYRAQVNPGTMLPLTADFHCSVTEPCSVFLIAGQNPAVAVRGSRSLVTGLVPLRHRLEIHSSAVGGEDFPIFGTHRRPNGQNFALRFSQPLDLWGPRNVVSGWLRPMHQPHTWVAANDDRAPSLTLRWPNPVTLQRVELFFDTDPDHSMETVLMGHPARTSPFCVKRYRLQAGDGRTIYMCEENHQTRNVIEFAPPVATNELRLEILDMNGPAAPAVRAIRCYA